MGKLSRAQVDEIEAWAAKGKSGLWISFKMEMPAATVNYRMLRAGFDPWPGSHNNPKNQRGGFTPEEDSQMIELSKAMSNYKVAVAMGRPRTSIMIRLMTLEVRAEKALENAA